MSNERNKGVCDENVCHPCSYAFDITFVKAKVDKICFFTHSLLLAGCNPLTVFHYFIFALPKKKYPLACARLMSCNLKKQQQL